MKNQCNHFKFPLESALMHDISLREGLISRRGRIQNSPTQKRNNPNNESWEDGAKSRGAAPSARASNQLNTSRERKRMDIYRWSTCRWSSWEITSPPAILPEKYQVRLASPCRWNPGFRSEESPPRRPNRGRPRRPSSRPATAANSAACSSSSGPGTITGRPAD